MTPNRQRSAVAFGTLFLLTGCLGSGSLEIEETAVRPGVVDPIPAPIPIEEGGPSVVVPADDRLKGAGGRDLTEFWESLDVPYSANVKMLTFDMMKSEVRRATGLTWVIGTADQWESNRAAFGGPNYTTTFTEDITPSPQKILLWRKMAYQVCLDAVVRDAGKATRVTFTEVDPALAISTSNAAVNAQIDALYQRFFLEAPSSVESTRAASLLAAAFADGSDPKEAWRALCVGYLASMKFLSY
jgi:hypothetical protein